MAAPRKTTAKKTTAKKTTARKTPAKPTPAPATAPAEPQVTTAPKAETAQVVAAPVESVDLALGAKGDRVAFVQDQLGVFGEKTFGPDTERAVKRWQKATGYGPTGILTARQYDRMRAATETE